MSCYDDSCLYADEDQSSERDISAEDKVNSLKEAIEEIGFTVEETQEGIRIGQ